MTLGKRAHAAAVQVAEGTDTWWTPDNILRPARLVAQPEAGDPGRIVLDPFWGDGCRTAPMVGVDEAHDGFAVDWMRVIERATGRLGATGCLDVFCNPPYSRMPDVARKVPREAARGVEIVALVKSATAENWFADLVWRAANVVCFVYGRVKFAPGTDAPPDASGNVAPFSSALAYYGRRPDVFADQFRSTGQIFRLR